MTPTLALFAALALPGLAPDDPSKPFVITIVDDQTGRGVPLVELKTVNEVRIYTDSAGVAAVFEPGLMGKPVYFHIKSHGYEFPADGFGYRGKALVLEPGGSATLKIRRLNIAERLYRVTGAGIYRDSILAGRPAPIREPLLNGRVFGSDSVLTARYLGKLYWFWGDTNRPDYPLGTFGTPGATSDLPGQGGLDPEIGVNLDYFVEKKTGFVKPTADLPGKGPTWLFGLAAFTDENGREQLVAISSKVTPNMKTYERGLVVFDPEQNAFQKAATFPLDSALRPNGQTFLRKEKDDLYIYYCTPFPMTRVRARMADLKEITNYEGFSPLKTGSRRIGDRLDKPELDIDAEGHVRFAWRKDTAVPGPTEESKVLGDDHKDETLQNLRDVETGAFVWAHSGSVHWNDYRKRWVMIAVQGGGSSSYLGEIWYAEAATPLGPWAYARKIVTHDRYSFYNPAHHPEFDKDGGRVIFFEGTYTATFSRKDDPTPHYDYNQVMYRLDLADPRLNLPVAVYRSADGRYTTNEAASDRPPIFFALEHPGVGTIPLVNTEHGLQAAKNPEATPIAFHALSEEAPVSSRALVSLRTVLHDENLPSVRVWHAPSSARLGANGSR